MTRRIRERKPSVIARSEAVARRSRSKLGAFRLLRLPSAGSQQAPQSREIASSLRSSQHFVDCFARLRRARNDNVIMFWLAFYNIILPFGMLAYLIYASLFKKKRMTPLKERLGRIPQGKLQSLQQQRPIWIQAVSVGEVTSVRPLISALRQEYPHIPIVLTTTTLKGLEIAQRMERPGLVVTFFPLDLPKIQQHFIQTVHPRLFLMIESEFWPNCIHQLARQGISMAVVNGRISDKSFPRYRIFRALIREFLSPIEFFLMQSEVDRQRLIEIGIPVEQIHITGNLKFDAAGLEGNQLPSSIAERFKKGPVWVAASTHEPEEKELYQVFRELRQWKPELSWVVAPRHVERADTLENWFHQQGEKVIRWSQVKDHASVNSHPSLILLDTIGELGGFYAIADLVFVGGSLIPHGGQNPLEAASQGKAVLFGPHLFNFQDIETLLLQEKAAIRVQNLDELKAALRHLLENPNQAQEIGKRARLLVERYRGVTQRTLEFLRPLMANRS